MTHFYINDSQNGTGRKQVFWWECVKLCVTFYCSTSVYWLLTNFSIAWDFCHNFWIDTQYVCTAVAVGYVFVCVCCRCCCAGCRKLIWQTGRETPSTNTTHAPASRSCGSGRYVTSPHSFSRHADLILQKKPKQQHLDLQLGFLAFWVLFLSLICYRVKRFRCFILSKEIYKIRSFLALMFWP